MDNAKNCQLKSLTCGNYAPYPDRLGCVVLKDLQANLGVLYKADTVITECDLICMRSTEPLNPDDFICPKHQFILGKDYKPSQVCKYSQHPKRSKLKGEKISWQLYIFVKSCEPDFILGSLICKTCQIKLNKLKREPVKCDDISSDPSFTPSVSIVNDDEKLKRRQELDTLTNIFEIERVRYQVNSEIQHMSAGSLNYFRNIHQKFQNELTGTFCRLVAPGQEQQMKDFLENGKKTDTDDTDHTVKHLKEAFGSCSTRKARRAVLMLIPKTYTKLDVCRLFGCTFYEIERARAVSKLYGACGEEPKHERVYSRISFEKGQHFINFLFSTGLLQEVAYGTVNLKLDSGDKLTVSDTILNGIHENAVKEYIIYCCEINYDPLGRSTLRKILDKMKPHTRKKLAGVDSFVVEGIEAFETLRLCVKLLESDKESKELLKSITRAEAYLKARFKTHCNYDDSCRSHCINHALSHPNDVELVSKCNRIHDSTCGECLAVVDCIALLKAKLSHLPSTHEREVAEFDVANSEMKVIQWQRHIMRGVQQSRARSDAFTNLGPTNSLWIRDFAQKYNPTKTLEAMNEYFGKRGMTVSVEVFIFKSFDSYHKQVYLVAMDRCDQGSLETLCIADTVLEEFSKDYPHIKTIELKSDNAGNYHANGVPECMRKLGQQRGITLSAYNYNEAQLGKDQCDREAAIFKRCAERWLLKKETHKISNAKELLEAVFSEGGPKNTKMCVLKIDTKTAKLEGVKNIKNISYYHTVEFQEDGALYREYYDIGEGKFHKYNDTKLTNGASRVVDWRSSKRQEKTMTTDNRAKYETFPCPETLCVLEFRNENEMISHVASATHKYAKTKSGMDNVILYYAKQKELQNSLTETTTSNCKNIVDSGTTSYSKMYTQGWARKVRLASKMTPKQKQFIETLFKNGSGKNGKLSAEQMAQEMKDKMISGEYYFRPMEYLEVSRIRSLISRLKNQENKAARNLFFASENDGIESYIDDICDSVLASDTEDYE